MNKKLIGSLLAVVLLAGCDYNNRNFEGLEKGDHPTDVKKLELEFTAYETLKGDAKTNGYFSETDPASNYLPAWLAKQYPTADNTSSAKVTFKYKENMSPLAKAFSDITYYKLANADYKLVHGEGYYANYLNSSTVSKLYKVLDKKIEDPVIGDVVMAEYNYNATAKPQKMEDPVYTFDFESLKVGDITSAFSGWYVYSEGGMNWQAKSYDDNIYPQYSANGAKGAVEGWLVTPKIHVTNATINLAFDVNVGYYNGDCLSVLISTDFNKDVKKATWKDVTSAFDIPQEPAKGYGTFASAGICNLAEYAGQDIYVAFKYAGNGANGADKKTTTYQLDNIVVGKDIPVLVKSEPQYALMEYTEKGWYAVSNDQVIMLTPADYTAMGDPGKNFNFSSTIKAEDYLPTFLAHTVQYPLADKPMVIVYKYYDKTVKAFGDEYVYSQETGLWAYNTRIVNKTEQYVLSDGKWNFDPSTVITLSTSKSDTETSKFYQTITDWVKENKGAAYVTSYGNNDYYYGGSAYNNNYDFRLSAWRGQVPSEYGSMDDAALTKLMFDRLPESFLPALEKLYGDAELVSGVEVTYTINFSIYDGSATSAYVIKFLVVGKGQFEYIDGSLQKL